MFVITSVNFTVISCHLCSGPFSIYMEDYFACVDVGRAFIMVGRTGSWVVLTEREEGTRQTLGHLDQMQCGQFPRASVTVDCTLNFQLKINFHTLVSFV